MFIGNHKTIAWRLAFILAFIVGLYGMRPVRAMEEALILPSDVSAQSSQIAVSFQQGVNSYTGTVDTFLRSAQATTAQGSAIHFRWDIPDPDGGVQYGLLRFDHIFGSGSNQIPGGVTVLSAVLEYYVEDIGDTANLNEVLVDWDETVTYNQFGGEAHVQEDEYGNLVGSASGSSVGLQSVDVTASLEAWASNPASNRGWIFQPTNLNGVQVTSSEGATIGNRPRLTVVYDTAPPNSAPNQPVLIAPANGSTNVSLSPSLGVHVTDPEGEDLTVTFYGRSTALLPPGPDFTIIAMPDTQHYTDGVGDPEIFAAQTQWIVDNRNSQNIVFVTGLGDIVQNGDINDSEWQLANHAYSLIEDPLTTLLADGIPYGLAVGNHDQSPIGGGSSASTSKYNQYFGEARFSGRAYYGGHYGSDNDNSYQLFSAGGMDFIIIHFEYDTTPELSVLNWADNLLNIYSNRRAILTTHWMINMGNPASWSPQGQALYNALSDHPNLFLMLGGHIHGEGRRQDTAVNGNVVHSLLSDYQDITNGGNGWLRIMRFSPANNTITVTTYSPTLNQFGNDTVMGQNTISAPFNIPYNMMNREPFVEIGTLNNVTSGSNSSMVWTGLDTRTEYEWYVTVDDGNKVTTGNTWSFTSTDTPPTAARTTTGVFRPSNGLLYLKNSNDTGFADIAINYGIPGDYPVVGDWDGDGDDTIGVYRNGSFYLRNSNTVGFADLVFPFGQAGDQPIAGDWDGDGDDTIGIYRPSIGQFLMRNSNSAGNAEMSFYLGNVGDVGIAGDWDGDGKDTTGVFRPVNGIIFLKNTNTTGFADVALNYGIPGDKPVIGDWDGNETDTIGVYRNGRFFLRNSNTIGFADIVFDLGNPGDMPIAGDWDGQP